MEASQSAANNNECYQISDEDDVEEDDICLQESIKSNENELSINGGPLLMRGPYERAWTTQATRALIHIRGPMEDKFNEGRQQRTTLWLLVTKHLHKLGFRYSPAKVQKKWHNILITYSKNISKKEDSGYVHWEFFEEMYKYLEGKKSPYDRKSVSNENNGCDEAYQFQQYFTESEEPLEHSNYDNNSSNFKYDDQNSDDNEEPNTAKRIKIENNTNNYSEKLPLEISQVRGGTEMPKVTETKNINTENSTGDDNKWWQDYFERKLQCEKVKLQLQKEMHTDVMNFNKMSLIQQEKIERIKIDAINNLTTTLQKLVEVKHVVKSDKIKDKNSM